MANLDRSLPTRRNARPVGPMSPHELSALQGWAAGLQFALAHPAVAAVIPGASKPARIAEDRSALQEVVPVEFWNELRRSGLVHPDAPLPING